MNGLEDKLKAAVLAAALTEQAEPQSRNKVAGGGAFRWVFPALAAAAAAAAVVLLPVRPEDTFDDPQLAYAEVEKAFAYMTRVIGEGSDIASRAGAPVEVLKDVFK